jgi:transaldolase
MSGIKNLNIKLFADGANISEMVDDYKRGIVSGFTTNPTLMRKANITNYEQFAKDAIKAIPDMPISFEVFSDDFIHMEQEARTIASWGKNIYIKIPVTTTKGESTVSVIKKLSKEGLKFLQRNK